MRLTRVRIARRKARRLGLRHKTAIGVIGGVLAVIPAGAMSDGATDWANAHPTEQTRDAALVGGLDPKLVQVNVDGSVAQPVVHTEPLPADELPSGPLGIPGTALRAYHHAADLMATEQPNCHIDWALIASIGRIESNHARGGYVDKNGTTLEPILGPELNGAAGVAAIPDTDGGRLDHDTIWDRAVGPTQFIPSTWNFYGADGNGDGTADPDNIYDATHATGRYLCSGGLDLADPAQLRAAIYRYNNSDVYVDTVILWAEAYRNGVAPLPDSTVPIGAPSPPAMPALPPVTLPPPPPPAPVTTTAPAPPTTTPPATAPSAPTTTSSTPGVPTPPTSGTSSTPPTCTSTSTSPTSTTVTTTPPASPDPCSPPTTGTTTDTSVRPTS
ncbi:MAG TPA: lytic murein transglycosylase [Amycolatopsis sp.]|nr:lytic murein transglycosylase [Amycolatopsis sp.]